MEFRPTPIQNRSFFRSIWNKEKKKLFGRTPLHWAYFTIYYCIFLIVIILMFLGCMHLLVHFANHHRKPLLSRRSLMGFITPAGITAMPYDIGTNVIRYSLSNKTSHLEYADIIKKALSKYGKFENKTACGNLNVFDHKNQHPYEPTDHSIKPTLPCRFDVSTLGPCATYPYGYGTLNPCLFIKVTRVFDWIPSAYSKYSPLPENIPDFLFNLIRKTERPRIWIHCESTYGNDPAKATLENMKYYPNPGIEKYYFPFYDRKNYQSPIVAVELPKIKTDNILKIYCYIWSKDSPQARLISQILVEH